MAFLSEGMDGAERVWDGLRESSFPLADDIRLMYEALVSLTACHSPLATLDVGAAGTVLRFLLPLAALHCDEPVRFSGSMRLFQRPLAPLLEALAKFGTAWKKDKNGGLLIPPESKPDYLELEVDGSLSSQFISGLAMSSAALSGGGIIRWKSDVVSRPYLSLTKLWLERFGCRASLLDNSFEVQGGLKYRTQKVEDGVEINGDWSAAAVAFCVAAVMGKDLKVGPLDNTDGQPDVAVLEILKKVGCSWRINNGECHFDGRLDEAVNADLLGCPDLAPPLAALAVFAPGVSILRGLRALPNKESDRLGGIINLVEWLGGRAELLPGPSLKIYPALLSKKSPVAAMPFDPMDDHRLAFAAAIGSLKVGGTVLNMECVNKSWPGFWQWAKIK
ncbi:MAG: hypothetical protein FWG12_02965 [Holophagaceae bacterium]|nr:hypothetical protein [Holophagaceae bacterium]